MNTNFIISCTDICLSVGLLSSAEATWTEPDVLQDDLRCSEHYELHWKQKPCIWSFELKGFDMVSGFNWMQNLKV